MLLMRISGSSPIIKMLCASSYRNQLPVPLRLLLRLPQFSPLLTKKSLGVLSIRLQGRLKDNAPLSSLLSKLLCPVFLLDLPSTFLTPTPQLFIICFHSQCSIVTVIIKNNIVIRSRLRRFEQVPLPVRPCQPGLVCELSRGISRMEVSLIWR